MRGQKKGLVYSKVRSLLALLPSPTPPHPSPSPLQIDERKPMPSTTAIATNPPPRPPPSSIVEPVQRPPVLSPKVADQRQQRSGSALPPSPRHSTPTPTLSTPSPPAENGSQSSEVSARQFPGPVLPSPSSPPLLFCKPRNVGMRTAHTLFSGCAAYRYGNIPADLGIR